jgi:tetratricopeptide (TPR) repeat protein
MIQKRLEQPSQDPAEIQQALEDVLGDTDSISATIESSCCQIDITPHFTEMISLINVAGDERETMPVSELLVPLFEDHVKTHPTYPDLRHGLGLLYLKLNRLDDAEKAFTEAVRLNPKYIKARIDLLKTLIRNKKFSQALPHGDFVLSKGLKYPDVFLALGEAALVLEQYDSALTYAENALAVKPSFAAAYHLMGRVLEKTGKAQEAILAYTQCLDLDGPRGLKQDADEGIKRLSATGKT